MNWIRNLKLNYKLLLMIAVPMLGVFYFSFSAVSEKLGHMNEMGRLQQLAQLAVSTNAVIHELQIERGLIPSMYGERTAAQLSVMREQRQEAARSAELFRKQFEAMNNKQLDGQLVAVYEKSVGALERLDEYRRQIDSRSIGKPEVMQTYLETIDSFFEALEGVSQRGDDEQVSDMMSALMHYSRSKIAVSQERTYVYDLLLAGTHKTADFERLGALKNQQETYYTVFTSYAEPEMIALHRSEAGGLLAVEVDRLRGEVLGTMPGEQLTVDPQAWFAAATERIEAMKRTEDTLSARLSVLMQQIEQNARQSLLLVLGFNLFVLLSSLLLIYFISRMLLTPIRALQKSTGLVLQGETEVELQVSSRDEIGDLTMGFQQMVESFRDVIRQADRISKGDYEQSIVLRSDRDRLSAALNEMLRSLKETKAENARQYWLKTQLARLMGMTQGMEDLSKLGSMLIQEICSLVEAGQGVFYIREESASALRSSGRSVSFVLLASYAFRERKHMSGRIPLGEGLVGQCAVENKPILLTHVPDDYIQIGSGLGAGKPQQVLVLPIVFEERTIAVLELASFRTFTDVEHDLLEQLSGTLGAVIQSIISRQRTEELLRESQLLAEELQTQQEELRTANEELEEQTQMLRQSEEKMRIQSEELQTINEELEEKTNYLELQKADIERQNHFIQQSKRELEVKAEELELASQYKSEFLANMSHELRTPLNSLLILAKSLAANTEGNLTEDQVESAGIIHSGGLDLLTLINDILDLSKVEAGKLDIHPDEVRLDAMLRSLHVQFQPLAREKGLELELKLEEGLPASIVTDEQRAVQILKNLLSNAFKFTHQGKITVSIGRPPAGTVLACSGLSARETAAFSVTDTGIGIPSHKQQAIFEAFQQADGSTSRKYGGTGLGLTISRELAKLLHGELQLHSREGEGSTFTLYLPLRSSQQQTAALDEPSVQGEKLSTSDAVAANDVVAHLMEPNSSTTSSSAAQAQAQAGAAEAAAAVDRSMAGVLAAPAAAIRSFIPDDREELHAFSGKEKTLLIIEDDPAFAKVLVKLSRSKGFKCVAAGDGFSGLQLVKRYTPTAVLLDLGLPDMDGLKVLDHLKRDSQTRHIPVHIISGKDAGPASLKRGAVGFMSKPISADDMDNVFDKIEHVLNERIKQVLVIEDDASNQKAIHELLKHKKIDIHSAFTGMEGLERMKEQVYDCVILDLKLPDMTGQELLERLVQATDSPPPMIINTGKELTQAEYKELNRFTDSIVIKGANSPERLLDEVSLFLHSVQKQLPEEQRAMLRMALDSDESLKGRKVLLVDDDMRNTFALSKVLRQHGLEVLMADNGKLAVEKLESESGIELVIMDIMMPVMDGYEAMRLIRSKPQYSRLPIIALTAKAMSGDREKCIEGGANDYMTKPVDTDKLLSLIRVWLFES
ncbi:response regulator [Paenibacillus sp. YYML68]|uniref:response regulator n=1 Tax=Paenibacillus sp. YYML68 TaxID=2909250 RepID=UPI00249377F4|nr:response regulator [Paenibacillus sp. YYML68]